MDLGEAFVEVTASQVVFELALNEFRYVALSLGSRGEEGGDTLGQGSVKYRVPRPTMDARGSQPCGQRKT